MMRKPLSLRLGGGGSAPIWWRSANQSDTPQPMAGFAQVSLREVSLRSAPKKSPYTGACNPLKRHLLEFVATVSFSV